jgi:hypothetical protein
MVAEGVASVSEDEGSGGACPAAQDFVQDLE